jgi:hypothetical protein
VYFSGVMCNDDSKHYINIAYKSANKILTYKSFYVDEPSNITIRYMFYVSMAIIFLFLGVSSFSASIWPIITSLGSIIVTFYLGGDTFYKERRVIGCFLSVYFSSRCDLFYSHHDRDPFSIFRGFKSPFFLER